MLGQWPADLRIQESRKEMVSELGSMLKSRLELWKIQGKHAAFPENLLVFRDGVSEGQYETVLNTELPLLRKACIDLYPPQDTKKGLPHITIIIVGKRHHTRFYPTAVSDADRSGNPKNGTIVDRGVTEVRYWDFFLQSHTALQGTARPAHYYIVLDEIFAKRKVSPPFQNVAEMLEDLIHNMCYLSVVLPKLLVFARLPTTQTSCVKGLDAILVGCSICLRHQQRHRKVKLGKEDIPKQGWKMC